ncbi:hypothetical protein AGMMS50249_5380 [candidate division SR1 bacterium]|nr:hypothetical protein AGMMS50249_5380 [candidate division SR1 bacterium]
MAYPTYQPRTKKTLSWSNTRITLLQRCERKYYFNYYTFALKDQYPELWKETLILKKLKSLEMRIGEKSHYLLSDYLHLLKKWTLNAESITDEERETKIQELKNQIKSEMEEEFAKSQSTDFHGLEGYFDGFGLSEHFYGENVEDQLPIAIQKVQDNLDRFIASPRNGKIENYFSSGHLVYVEHPRNSNFEAMKVDVSKIEGLKDITVMAAPDFGVTISNTDYIILDWKSGKEDITADEISNQLKVYALKMLIKKGSTNMEGIRIEAHEVYLQSMNSHGGILKQQDIDDIITRIQTDVAAQKSFLIDEDPYKNEPVDYVIFRKTTNAKKCETCTFKDVCQKLEG